MSSPAPTRRGVLTGAAALAAAGYAAPASAHGHHGVHGHEHTARLTILGTTDLHGNVFNWDYYKNAEYDDAAAQRHRHRQGADPDQGASASAAAGQPLLMLDAGDTIQGTPLAYYYAKVEPITSGGIHPMAKAMNLIGYDAAALGNHEFNYGIPLLRDVRVPAELPAARRERRRPGHRAAGLPALPRQDACGCPTAPTSRSASSA